MKKLLLSLFMMAGLASFAQQDIQITLDSPASGDTILNRTSFNINYTIKNLGSPITTSDTIAVAYLLGGNFITVNGSPLIQVIVRDIPTDSSITGRLTGLSLAINTAGTANLCAVAILEGDSVNDENNLSCSSIVLAFNTGISEVEKAANSVKVFPNPASTVVNFTIDYNKAEKVLVYDIAGKLVETTSFEFNKAELNVSALKTGIYMYQIVDNNGTSIKAGKFNVQ